MGLAAKQSARRCGRHSITLEIQTLCGGGNARRKGKREMLKKNRTKITKKGGEVSVLSSEGAFLLRIEGVLGVKLHGNA